MKVDDLFLEIMLHPNMSNIPAGYKSYCFSAIKETLQKNGISMEREVQVELSESIYESVSNDSTELHKSTTYDELFR